MRKRRSLASVAGAVLGLGALLPLTPRLPWKASAGQLPGYAAARGFDPSGGALRLALFVLLPLCGGALAWRLARPRPRPAPPRRAVRPRRPRFLVPAAAAHALTAWIFFVPLAAPLFGPRTLLAALFLASLGLAIALGGGHPERGAACLGAAAAILPFALLGPRPPTAWLPVGLAGYALPVVARWGVGTRPAAARALRVATVWVLLPGSVTALGAAACMRVPRIVDVFEDGHALLPASEYLRGERPYRDIVPGHGLVSDGLLAAGQLWIFGDDYTGLKRGEKAAGAFFWPAVYALGLAATGSPAVGLGGLLLTFLFFPQYANLRMTASLWTLALALSASRTRKAGAWIACGAALPLCLCVAVEFAAYAAAGAAVALWIARGRRGDHWRRLVLGALVSTGAIAVVLGACGVLAGFVRTTFVFVPALLPVYALGFGPAALPRGLAALCDETLLYYGFVTVSVVLLGAWLPRGPAVGPRGRSVLPICAWAVAAMLSVLERRHVGYGLIVVPLGLILAARWMRGWRRRTSASSLAPAAALALLVWLRHPAFFVAMLADAIAHPRPRPGLAALAQPARARGGLFRPADATLVGATADMMRRAGFRAGDTWFDFASMPGLYYLFDRDCPIRYYEVGFYETDSAQREVIAAVESNPRVRAALLAAPWGEIDGIPNDARAPLVGAFLRQRFRPFYREGGVEFWLRREGGAEATSASR